MPGQPAHVPLDDPNIERYHNAHIIDYDAGTTNLGISLARDAYAAGYPDDPEAGPKTLAGPAGGAAVNAAMAPSVEVAVAEDEAAEEFSVAALHSARDAKEAADRRSDLPNQEVLMANGSSLTLGQVQAGHDERTHAAAQHQMRGDFEHQERQPGPAVRFLVVPVLALIEMFLLIWPVTNASWSDPRSVAYFAGLAAIFIFMNEMLPRLAGNSIRDEREARHAARELTAVGMTLSQDGDTAAGRAISGHADARFVRESRRKMILCCAAVGTAIAIYAAVMATRVVRLAAPLGSLLFAALAAALITVFTAGALVYMTRWWSRGNALGDQQREHGARLDQGRAQAQDLKDQSHAFLTVSSHAGDEAERHLRLGDQAMSDGAHCAGRALQKAAKILGLESVPTPAPENLIPVDRPIQARAMANLKQAAAIRAEVNEILNGPHPFQPAGPAPNPWEIRTRPRRGVPNQDFVDPAQIGPLHAAADGGRAGRRFGPGMVLALAALLAAAAIVAITLYAHL